MSPFFPSRTQLKNRQRALARGTSVLPAGDAPAGWNPERVWKTTGIDLRKIVATAPESVVRYVHAQERENPRAQGARTTVLDRCEERLGELRVMNPHRLETDHAD